MSEILPTRNGDMATLSFDDLKALWNFASLADDLDEDGFEELVKLGAKLEAAYGKWWYCGKNSLPSPKLKHKR